MKILMDKEQWSEDSRRSYSYDSSEDYYEDICYKCYTCGCAAIFTAQDQKETYEIKKRYIWQRRKLCPLCYENLNTIKQKISEYERLWETEGSEKSNAVISEWLGLIRQLPKYGKAKNESLERKLSNLLAKNT
jgi:hypothetical protein